MKTIISLGGSVLVPERIDIRFIKEFIMLIRKYKDLIIIIGGGRTSRIYQDAARELGVSHSDGLDKIGIAATRINAELLKAALAEDAYPELLTDPSRVIETGKIIVGCGSVPGATTDLRAAQAAKAYGGRNVINVSDVGYVYSKDPSAHKDAEKYDSLSWDEYLRIVGEDYSPGSHWPFDPVAARYAKENGLAVLMLGPDLENLKAAIENKEKGFRGTIIS